MATTKWGLDHAHSEIQFKVKHMLISKVTGHFKKFDASVETEGDDLSTSKVSFSADINSISTNNEQRDAHLGSADFFDAENHPSLSFVSDKMKKIDEENYRLEGTLTMRGVSKPISFDIEFGGLIKDPWGNERVGFSITGKINRKEFGVSFNMLSETGGILLGEDVAIHAQAEFVKVPEAVTA